MRRSRSLGHTLIVLSVTVFGFALPGCDQVEPTGQLLTPVPPLTPSARRNADLASVSSTTTADPTVSQAQPHDPTQGDPPPFAPETQEVVTMDLEAPKAIDPSVALGTLPAGQPVDAPEPGQPIDLPPPTGSPELTDPATAAPAGDEAPATADPTQQLANLTPEQLAAMPMAERAATQEQLAAAGTNALQAGTQVASALEDTTKDAAAMVGHAPHNHQAHPATPPADVPTPVEVDDNPVAQSESGLRLVQTVMGTNPPRAIIANASGTERVVRAGDYLDDERTLVVHIESSKVEIMEVDVNNGKAKLTSHFLKALD